MSRIIGLLSVCGLLGSLPDATAQTVIYDGISPFTTLTGGGHPRAFQGQAFNVDPTAGGPAPVVLSMRLGLHVGSLFSFPNPRVRVQFWGTFDPAATGALPVFSNPIGSPSVFNLPPIDLPVGSAQIFTLNFDPPIALPSTTNLGIAVNCQTSIDGVHYTDSEGLGAAHRIPGIAPIPIGQNSTTGNNAFFANVGNPTNFNFQANEARIFSNGTQATDGLAFDLRVVPEPGIITLCSLVVFGFAVLGRKGRRPTNMS